MKKMGIFVLVVFLAISSRAADVTLTFDNAQLAADRQLNTSRQEFWNGTTRNAVYTTYDGSYNPTYGDTASYAIGGTATGNTAPLVVGGANFSNTATWDETYQYWSWYGFGVSNAKNSATTLAWGGNLGNEMVSYAENSGNNQYLIGYWQGTDYATYADKNDSCLVTFGETVLPISVSVSNATWTALGSLNGDGFTNGLQDGDAVTLVITKTADNWQTTPDRIEVDLAHKNSGEEKYVLADWTNVDLSSLGETDQLYFNLDLKAEDYGGILGQYGANIATYFAMDNLSYQTAGANPPADGTNVPEPSTWVLLLMGVIALWRKR